MHAPYMHSTHPSTAIFSFVAPGGKASNSTSASKRHATEKAMRTTTETIRTIDLGYDQMMVFDGGRDGRVRVLFGATWLTQEDDAGDTFLRAGAEVALHGGRTVIEGLEPTRLQIVERPGRSQRACTCLAEKGLAQRRVGASHVCSSDRWRFNAAAEGASLRARFGGGVVRRPCRALQSCRRLHPMACCAAFDPDPCLSMNCKPPRWWTATTRR